MKFDYCVIGGTGAVGAAIANLLSLYGSVSVLNSQNCNLLRPEFTQPAFRARVVINAAGTFGGLKQYESGMQISEDFFLLNLVSLIKALNPEYLINISSAALLDSKNFSTQSVYRNYVTEKLRIESELQSICPGLIGHLRCTNIVSKYENYQRSGHSVASIYRNILDSKNNVEIWSSEHDWREYIDADDVAMVVFEMIKRKIFGTFAIGSGIRSYIHEIVNVIAVELNYCGEIIFTQPHKAGPLQSLVGIPQEFEKLLGPNFPTKLSESVKKCVTSWRNLTC